MTPNPGSVAEANYLSNLEQAESNVLARKLLVRGASSLEHRDGRTLVAEALGDMSASDLRDLTVQARLALLSERDADLLAMGRIVMNTIIGYASSCPGFVEEVHDEAVELLHGAANDEDDDRADDRARRSGL